MPKILLPILLLVVSGCGGSKNLTPQQLAEKLPLTQETAHYTFHYSTGSQLDTARQEAYHVWAVAQLNVDLGRKIDYYKYVDRSQMKSITGQDTNGWADPPNYAVHSIWPWDNHEVVHVMTALIGRPSDFFNEGIAVAFSVDPMANNLVPQWLGQPVHDYARSLLQQNRIPPLSGIVDTSSFRKLPDTDSYAIAGSFMKFLIDRNGIETCKEFFRSSTRDDSSTTIAATFQRVYGESLTGAEQDWLTFLRTK